MPKHRCTTPTALPPSTLTNNSPIDTSGLRIREAVRALVVDENQHVLLALLQFPTRSVWVLPGGGIEEGEEHDEALRRELREEVGLSPHHIGEHLWTRTHVIAFIDGNWDGQRDHAYLVHASRFQPAPELSVEQLRSEYLVELRWWSPEELTNGPSDAFFAPVHLPQLVADVLRDGPPDTPVQIFQQS